MESPIDEHDREPPAGFLRRPRGRFFTAGNLTSVSRVALLPALLWAIGKPPEQHWLVFVGVLAAVIAATDALDGFLSRRLGQVSEFGRILDPLADKICIGFVAVWLWLYRGLPIWIPAAILARDVFIVVGSLVLARRADLVMPSNQIGRITTFVLSATFFVYAIDWTWPQSVLLWASTAFVLVSFALYGRVGWYILHGRSVH